MVYCDQDMCESKLGRLMQAFRADRPSEWQMDEFIGMAERMHNMNQELLAALEQSVGLMDHLGDAYGCVPSNYIEYKEATKAISKAKGGAA